MGTEYGAQKIRDRSQGNSSNQCWKHDPNFLRVTEKFDIGGKKSPHWLRLNMSTGNKCTDGCHILIFLICNMKTAGVSTKCFCSNSFLFHPSCHWLPYGHHNDFLMWISVLLHNLSFYKVKLKELKYKKNKKKKQIRANYPLWKNCGSKSNNIVALLLPLKIVLCPLAEPHPQLWEQLK